MNILKNPAWWIPVLLLSMHQLIQRGFNAKVGLLDDYLDPLLCLPILLGLWLAERRMIFRVPRLSGLEVVVAGLVLAVLFEEGFPQWQPAFTRDWWDYLAYAAGGTWFWWAINPPAENTAGPQDAK